MAVTAKVLYLPVPEDRWLDALAILPPGADLARARRDLERLEIDRRKHGCGISIVRKELVRILGDAGGTVGPISAPHQSKTTRRGFKRNPNAAVRGPEHEAISWLQATELVLYGRKPSPAALRVWVYRNYKFISRRYGERAVADSSLAVDTYVIRASGD
jgi:hypothetical protein